MVYSYINKYTLGWVCSVTIIAERKGLGDPSLIPYKAVYISIRSNTLEEVVSPTIIPTVMDK